jgi:hypothetical protein
MKTSIQENNSISNATDKAANCPNITVCGEIAPNSTPPNTVGDLSIIGVPYQASNIPSRTITGSLISERITADWLPRSIAERLNDPKESVRNTAQFDALCRAQKIFGGAYLRASAVLVGPKLPPGLAESGFFEIHAPPVARWSWPTMSRQRMIRLAGELAEMYADNEADGMLTQWVKRNLDNICHGLEVDRFEVNSLLLDALDELNHTQSTTLCVTVWVRSGAHGKPPSWHAMEALIREHPEVARVGLRGMIGRGVACLPWIAAALS